ncbi:MAG: type II secretion system F family protein [Bacilli bacterium]|nr:type II secretion system F family protein [Bacilli bacterium]
MELYLLVLLLICLILLLVWLFIKSYNSYKLTKRFNNYTVDYDNDTLSIVDVLVSSYRNIEEKLSRRLIKTHVFDDYSKKYIKYSGSKKLLTNMNYISRKIFIGLLCLLLLICNSFAKENVLTIVNILISFLAGFFLYDIYLYVLGKYEDNRLDNDISEAIVIMNNAFKSGKSIIQAIDLVAKEMQGPISIEFKRISEDIKFGLDIEEAFKRFSKRVKSVEATYLTSSISVLSKTGGNIVSVFDSIEKNALARKKLREELKSNSSQARFVYRILVSMPPILVLFLLLLNPAYFVTLFTTTIGFLAFVLIIMLYVFYIIIIRKIVYIEVKL